MTKPDHYCTAKEAAATLGVTLPTLYCYVSRGLVRTHRTPGERQSRYWRSDIEQFRRRRQAQTPAQDTSFGHDSSITLLTPNELFYRGVNAVELAKTHTFEAVTALLWQMPEEELFRGNLPVMPPHYESLAKAVGELAQVDRVLALAPFLEHSNPRSFDLAPAVVSRNAAAILRWVAATVAHPCVPSERPIHLVLARAEHADDPVADVVRRLLILSADHEMDPTTLAVRAAANTGITPWRILMTGLIASEGRRGSFGRMQAASHWLQAVFNGRDPVTVVVECLKLGGGLPGFGPNIYQGKDPRTRAMLKALEKRLGHMKTTDHFLRAIEAGRHATGLEPDFGLIWLAVTQLLGLDARDANILRLARFSGWIAHGLEQYREHDLVRVRSRYQGRLPSK